MSISADDIIQTASGNFNASTGTISLPAPTTDGSTVLVFFNVISANISISGFTRPHGVTAGTPRPAILYKANVAAGENDWVTGSIAANSVAWVAMEIQNVSRLNPVEVWANPSLSNITGTVIGSNTTLTPSTSYETLVFALHVAQNASNNTVPSFSGHTNGFTQIATSSRAEASTAVSLSVSLLPGLDIGSYQCTATSSVTVNGNAVIVAVNAEGARRVPNLDLMSGAEHGTAAGRATGIAGGPPVDASNGSVSVVTTSPRSGNYCWELTGSGAAANIAWTTTGAMSLYPAATGFTNHRQYVARFSFYAPTSLPGSDVTIAAIDNGTGLSGAGVQIVYRAGSQKIGVQVVEDNLHVGTEVLSATTVTAGAWHDIDVYLDMTNRTRAQRFYAYWRLNGVDQTTAEVTTTTQVSVATFTQLRLGWTTASTAQFRFDDIAGSKHPGHYPLGDLKIVPLTVDPAGTVTVTTAANFSTFTANGTLNGTFSAATARGAVDDLPPTIGASADGLVQDTVDSAGYVEVPMSTYAMYTALQVPRGIRWYFCGWAAAAGPTTAATIGFRSNDGVAETTLFAAAEANFQNSTTAPAWMCRMHRTLSSATPPTLTQARIDALTARVGFSTDATPVVGVHSIMAELAVRNAEVQQVIETDGVFVYAILDPDTSNVIAMRLVAPADGAAWAQYTINGVTENRSALAGGEDLLVVGAEANSVVSYWTAGRS